MNNSEPPKRQRLSNYAARTTAELLRVRASHVKMIESIDRELARRERTGNHEPVRRRADRLAGGIDAPR